MNELRATCAHTRMQRGNRPGQCHKCDSDVRQAACSHAYPPTPHWAGILGWRYTCPHCYADMPDPAAKDTHTLDSGGAP